MIEITILLIAFIIWVFFNITKIFKKEKKDSNSKLSKISTQIFSEKQSLDKVSKKIIDIDHCEGRVKTQVREILVDLHKIDSDLKDVIPELLNNL